MASIRLVPGLALAVVLLAPSALHAQIGGDFGVLTFGSLSLTNSSAGGRVAAGGAIQLTNFGVGTQLTPGSGLPTVVAGGSAALHNGQVNQGGVVHGGAAAISGVGLPHGSSSSGTFLDFLALEQQQTTLSTSLAGMTATGTTSVSPWNEISLAGSGTGLNVFFLDASSLATASSFSITAPASSTVIVNVSGFAAQMQNFGFSLHGVGANAVLFNFFEASALSLRHVGVQGSVLAPLATVQGNGGDVFGDFVANSYAGTTAFHNRSFGGSLPMSTVPEPGTIALVGGGLALLGLAARRRTRHSGE